MTITKRRHSPVQAEPQPVTFHIDTPHGLIPVEYGKHGRDTVSTVFQGHHIDVGSVDDLRAALDRIVDMAEAKREHERNRREAAKNPYAGLLFRRGEFTEVGVRGIDQRDGKVLITYPDGDKGKSGGVLRGDMTDSDKADLIALYRAEQRASEDLSTKRAPAVREVLAERGIEVTLDARLDTTTGERVTVFDGREYRAGDARDLVSAVLRDLIRDEFPYVENRARFRGDDDAPQIVPIGEAESLHDSDDLYRSEEQYAAEAAAREAQREAREALRSAEAEFAFDKSMFADEV